MLIFKFSDEVRKKREVIKCPQSIFTMLTLNCTSSKPCQVVFLYFQRLQVKIFAFKLELLLPHFIRFITTTSTRCLVLFCSALSPCNIKWLMLILINVNENIAETDKYLCPVSSVETLSLYIGNYCSAVKNWTKA